MTRFITAIVVCVLMCAGHINAQNAPATGEGGSKVSIVANSLQVKPEQVSKDMAKLTVTATLENTTRKRKDLGLRSTLYDAFGRVVAQGSTRFVMRPSRRKKAGQSVTLEKPRLWSPEDPALYTLVTEVVDDDKVTSRQQTTLGIRTTGSEGGQAIINGQYKPLRAVRIDARAIKNNSTARRLMRLLSEAGANAVVIDRMAASDLQMLDYADREGIMVIDTAMTLGRAKTANRNHPSAMMWNNPGSDRIGEADSLKLMNMASRITERAAIMDEAGFPTADFYRLQAEWGGNRGFGNCYKAMEPGGAPAAVRLTAEQQEISASDFRPAYVAVEIVDSKGRVCTDAAVRVDYTVNQHTGTVMTCNGRALIEVNGDGRKGAIKVSARAAGLKNGKATVKAL